LKTEVGRAFEAQNITETPRIPVRPIDGTGREAQRLQELLVRRMGLEAEYAGIQQQRAFTQIRRRVTISALLDDLALLDRQLKAMGQDGLDVADLPRTYLPEGPPPPLKTPPATPMGMKSKPRPKSDLRLPINTSRLD
jgi:hypothetical protein